MIAKKIIQILSNMRNDKKIKQAAAQLNKVVEQCKQTENMKKSAIKHGDALHLGIVTQSKELEGSRIAGVIGKAATDGVTYPDGTLQIRSIINTTNIIDSHMDLHVPGLWKKNLAESKKRYLLNQHKQTFEGVISREVTATAKKFSWPAIGFDYEGSTEGLVFDSIVRLDDSAYMYDQYSKGHVLEPKYALALLGECGSSSNTPKGNNATIAAVANEELL